jgi:hypothetical protein
VPESPHSVVIKKFFTDLKDGGNGSKYRCDGKTPKNQLKVNNWTIEKEEEKGKYLVKVDYTTKEGEKRITKWYVSAIEKDDKASEYCIDTYFEIEK